VARATFFFASGPLEYDHRDRGQQQELLTAAFAGAGWEVPRLEEAANAITLPSQAPH
jgi:hypothetical protein